MLVIKGYRFIQDMLEDFSEGRVDFSEAQANGEVNDDFIRGFYACTAFMKHEFDDYVKNLSTLDDELEQNNERRNDS